MKKAIAAKSAAMKAIMMYSAMTDVLGGKASADGVAAFHQLVGGMGNAPYRGRKSPVDYLAEGIRVLVDSGSVITLSGEDLD